MNFFVKLVRLTQNGSGSFGIDTKTIPKKFGGPTMFRTSTIDLVPSQSQNVSHESEIVEPSETGFETVISECSCRCRVFKPVLGCRGRC